MCKVSVKELFRPEQAKRVVAVDAIRRLRLSFRYRTFIVR
jgi:hypothetical protein